MMSLKFIIASLYLIIYTVNSYSIYDAYIDGYATIPFNHTEGRYPRLYRNNTRLPFRYVDCEIDNNGVKTILIQFNINEGGNYTIKDGTGTELNVTIRLISASCTSESLSDTTHKISCFTSTPAPRSFEWTLNGLPINFVNNRDSRYTAHRITNDRRISGSRLRLHELLFTINEFDGSEYRIQLAKLVRSSSYTGGDPVIIRAIAPTVSPDEENDDTINLTCSSNRQNWMKLLEICNNIMGNSILLTTNDTRLSMPKNSTCDMNFFNNYRLTVKLIET